MILTISNTSLTAKIDTHGAELISLQSEGIEFIWQADPNCWNWHAPILFPFIGRLKENQYTYKGKTYSMPEHGFIRDCQFDILAMTNELAILTFSSTSETLQYYPFTFTLNVKYEIWGEGLRVHFTLENTGDEEMLFALGSHPAFNIPLEDHLTFNDYYLSFFPSKCRTTIPLEEHYANLEKKTLGQTNTCIGLNHELFCNNSLIYETKGFNAFILESEKSIHDITVAYKDFPYVALWSPYQNKANFVSIAPWHGITDTTTSTGKLEDWLGMNRLLTKEKFKTEYSIIVH
ncbi:aldose 1-epimerase family protein [Enterococcus sp. AZ109]|uniref:aldose 1-epimerase family protein n=1 Tax=Enterococcus sp. AZ109 TaxID=2774634 RepID=UPI003F20338B